MRRPRASPNISGRLAHCGHRPCAASGCDLLTGASGEPHVESVETIRELPPLGDVGNGDALSDGAESEAAAPKASVKSTPSDRILTDAKKKNLAQLEELRAALS